MILLFLTTFVLLLSFSFTSVLVTVRQVDQVLYTMVPSLFEQAIDEWQMITFNVLTFDQDRLLTLVNTYLGTHLPSTIHYAFTLQYFDHLTQSPCAELCDEVILTFLASLPIQIEMERNWQVYLVENV